MGAVRARNNRVTLGVVREASPVGGHPPPGEEPRNLALSRNWTQEDCLEGSQAPDKDEVDVQLERRKIQLGGFAALHQ